MSIHIVVPVYNAYSALKTCLKSLEKHNNGNVTLINDASTDERIKPLLDSIAKKNNWQIIHQKINQGFVKTANTGLRLDSGDTLLLNSDTIVTKPWIKAFTLALKQNPTLGTATPWSNNAEICSFPNFLKNHKVPKKLNRISKILFKNHLPQYPMIPTAVGFCMLVSEKAKKLVGYLDEQHFGHGYGEENDYSLRVIQMGLKNILVDNAYVAHVGNQSFSDLGIKPSEETMQRLLEKQPKYLDMIQEYIGKDSLSDLRKDIVNKLQQKGVKF